MQQRTAQLLSVTGTWFQKSERLLKEVRSHISMKNIKSFYKTVHSTRSLNTWSITMCRLFKGLCRWRVHTHSGVTQTHPICTQILVETLLSQPIPNANNCICREEVARRSQRTKSGGRAWWGSHKKLWEDGEVDKMGGIERDQKAWISGKMRWIKEGQIKTGG